MCLSISNSKEVKFLPPINFRPAYPCPIRICLPPARISLRFGRFCGFREENEKKEKEDKEGFQVQKWKRERKR